MRHYECVCTKCGRTNQKSFNKPYPEYGDIFVAFCHICNDLTNHTRTMTKKTKSEIKQMQEEALLKQIIIDACTKYGFQCRFLYESVIITTELSSWSFRYHDKMITLRHESTYKVNLETGNYARTHIQFKDRAMKPTEVIDYIASHEEWKKSHSSK